MDEILAKALKEREHLRERLAELEAFLAVYQRLSGSNVEQSTSKEIGDKSQTISDAVRKNTGGPGRLADAAEEVIRAAGRPMTRGQIVERIEATGIGIPSEDKARYLGTILWRQKNRFINVEGEGYWLKGEPIPPNPEDPGIFG